MQILSGKIRKKGLGAGIAATKPSMTRPVRAAVRPSADCQLSVARCVRLFGHPAARGERVRACASSTVSPQCKNLTGSVRKTWSKLVNCKILTATKTGQKLPVAETLCETQNQFVPQILIEFAGKPFWSDVLPDSIRRG